MARVVSTKYSKIDTISSSLVVNLPPHENGDLILIFAGNDWSNNNYNAVTGWVKEVDITGDDPCVVYSHHATSSSTADPTITTALATRQLSATAVIVRDVPSSSAVDVVGNSISTAFRSDTQSVTTTQANDLVFNFVLVNHQGFAPYFEGTITQIAGHAEFGAYSYMIGWFVHDSASATPTHKYANDFSGGRNVVRITVAVKDSGGNHVGQVSPYTKPCELITPFQGNNLTYYDDAAKEVDPTSLITTIKGTATTYEATAQWNAAHPFIEVIATRGYNIGSTTNWNKYLVAQLGLGNTWDLSTNSKISFTVSADNIETTYDVGARYIGFGSGDSVNVATGAKLFQVEASDTKVKTNRKTGLQVHVIDVGQTADETYGTLTQTAVTKLFVAGYHVSSISDYGYGFIYQQFPLIAITGSTTNPCNYQTIADFTQSNVLNTVKNQGGSSGNQFFSAQDIQIGDGSRALTWNSSYQSVEFPSAFDASALDVAYNVPSAGFNHTIKAAAGNSVTMISTTCSMGDFHNWTIDASTSNTNIYDFTGCTVLNATVTLQNLSNITYSGLTFINSKEVTHNGADLSKGIGVTMDSCVDAQAFTATGATQAALQTALDKIANCTFNNNTVAIRVEFTGTGNITLNFDNITWAGNTTDIHYNSTNASQLTANMQNGSNATTSAISGAATGVTISNDKTFTIICQDDTGATLTGAEVTILQTGTQTEDFHVETSATGTEAYTFTAPLGHNVDVQVFKPGYERYWEENRDLGSADSNLTVQLRQVPAYEA